MKVFQTSNFRRIHQACTEALEHRVKGMFIVGDRGQGRTLALTQFCKDHPELCLYGEFKRGLKANDFIASLLSQTEVEGKNEYDLARKLNCQLQNSGRKLLVIDSFDLELLGFCIDMIETFNEVTLIVSCSTSVFTAMWRKQQNDIVLKKILRKVKGKVTLSRPRKDEIKDIAYAYGINDTREIEHLTKEVKSFRHLQFLVNQKLTTQERV